MIWTILGVSVAVLAVFSISVAEMLVGKPIFENNREYIAGGLAAAGVVAYFIGRVLESRRAAAASDQASHRFLLFDLRYWGPMLLALGIITLFIRPLRHAKIEQIYTAAKNVPQKVLAREIEPEKPVAPAVFPDLKIQGVIYRNERPVAIINGDSYSVGDRLGNVIVKSIDRRSVLLEMGTEVRLLTLN
jgi:hypothetical protein